MPGGRNIAAPARLLTAAGRGTAGQPCVPGGAARCPAADPRDLPSAAPAPAAAAPQTPPALLLARCPGKLGWLPQLGRRTGTGGASAGTPARRRRGRTGCRQWRRCHLAGWLCAPAAAPGTAAGCHRAGWQCWWVLPHHRAAAWRPGSAEGALLMPVEGRRAPAELERWRRLAAAGAPDQAAAGWVPSSACPALCSPPSCLARRRLDPWLSGRGVLLAAGRWRRLPGGHGSALPARGEVRWVTGLGGLQAAR